VACHREIIIYLLKYAKGITDNLTLGSNSSSDDSVEVTKPQPPSSSSASSTTQNATTTANIADICQFNLIAKMNKLSWEMFSTNSDTQIHFGDLQIHEFETLLKLTDSKTDLRVKLKEIIINYDGNQQQQQQDEQQHHNKINMNYKK
jgi:hypothetical protein